MKKLLLTISFIINATSVSAEYAEALKDLEVLAKQGDLATQIKLANAYRGGLGVPQDYKTAVKWFTLAAEQGDAVAQYNLGIMHSFGLGVVPNFGLAVKWYVLAAEQGDTLAQYNLGRLYYLGQGVTENIVYAHMWANQSSIHGLSMGEELTELLIELMSPAQIEEARRLEIECVNKNYKGC
jgi:TPR repeat protein